MVDTIHLSNTWQDMAYIEQPIQYRYNTSTTMQYSYNARCIEDKARYPRNSWLLRTLQYHYVGTGALPYKMRTLAQLCVRAISTRCREIWRDRYKDR